MSSSFKDFDIQVAHSIAETDQDAWDRLAQGRPFAGSNWYRFAELVLEDILPIYIILIKDDQQVARSTCWLHRQEPLPIPSRLVRWGINQLIRRRPLLICRTPLVDVQGLILPSPSLREAALVCFTQVFQDLASQHKVSYMLFDYLGLQERERMTWPPEYQLSSLSSSGTYLSISRPDFDHYLMQLGASTRRNYHRNQKRVASQGITIRRYSKVSSIRESLNLIRNVEKHHKSAPNPWAEQVLENLSYVNATWIAAEQGDRLVAGGLMLRDGPFGVLTLLARDYSVEYAYFAVVFEAIRVAVESGVQLLRGGSGAYEFKKRLGFAVDENSGFAYTSFNQTLQWLGRQF